MPIPPQVISAGLQIGGALLSGKGGGKSSREAAALRAKADEGFAAVNEVRQGFASRLGKHNRLQGRVQRDIFRAAAKLDEKTLTTQGLQNVRAGFQKQRERLKATAALQGKEASGLTDQQLRDLDLAQVTAEADVRLSAPVKALEIQQGVFDSQSKREAVLSSGLVATTGQTATLSGQYLTAAGQAEGRADEKTGFGIKSLVNLASPGSGAGGKGSAAGDLASFIGSLGGA